MQLGADEVDVWLARPSQIADDALRSRYLDLLSAEERAQHRRFHFERDRELYLVAHALVRSTLSRYAALEPAAWSFVHNRYGRPDVAPGSCALPLRFNLSHTRDLAACAVTLGRDVGIDVEDLRRPGETVSLASQFFAADEVRALQALPAARQRDRFFSYWTLKESYIKARGMGLSIPLEQFAFELAHPTRIGIRFLPPLADDPARWQFERAQVTPDHVLAVAVERRAGETLRLRVQSTVPLQA